LGVIREGDFMYLKNSLKKFWQDDTGQSTTEYILILAVVVMIAMKFRTQIGKVLEGAVDKLEGDITTAIDGTD